MLYHSHTPDEAVRDMHSSTKGLSNHEARQRRQRYGTNYHANDQPRAHILRPFDEMYLLLLALACGMALIIDQLLVATGIAGIILVNLLLRILQHRMHASATQLHARLTPHHALVKRDGIGASVPSEDIVPGDIVILYKGDSIPADGRLLHATELRVKEFQLTGSARAIEKHVDPVHSDSELADRSSMVYYGSYVTSGSGEYIVTATGKKTEYSTISQQTANQVKYSTVQQKVASLTQKIVLLSLCATVTLIALAIARGAEWYMAVEYSIVLILAAIPAMLPVVIMIITTQGITTLATGRARVTSLRAIEYMSMITTFVVGKKEFLTSSAPKIAELWHPSADSKSFTKLVGQTIAWQPDERDEVDKALALQSSTSSVARPAVQILFDPAIEISGNIWHHARNYQLVIKGEPEKILSLCATTEELDQTIRQHIQRFEEEGYQILAVASLETEEQISSIEKLDSMQTPLMFAGLIALEYAPVSNLDTITEKFIKAGILPKIATGDTANGAFRLAQKLGVSASRTQTIDTRRLEHAQTDDNIIRDAQVYARATHTATEHIVASLKQHDVVAASGQSVDDIPILRRAHVGISTPQSATLVHQASDVVLMSRKNHLATLYEAIASSRMIMSNIRRVLYYTLTINLAEVTIILSVLLFALPLALTPLQILWANLIVYTILVLGLAVEPLSRNIMKRRPVSPRLRLVPGYLGARICLLAGVMAFVTMVVFFVALQTQELAYAQALAFHTFVVLQTVSVLAARSDHTSLFVRFRTWSPAVYMSIFCIVIIQGCLLFSPIGEWLLGSSLQLSHIASATAFALLLFIATSEASKLYSRRMVRKKEERVV